MDDLWLLLQAEDTVKDWYAWGTPYKEEPRDWPEEDYATIICIAQQLYLEREQEFYIQRRREASRKRAANREE